MIYFLPGELYEQEQIEVLILKCNNLRYIDPKIGQLINLETLDLRGNVKLASLPESLINCPKLIDIRLSNDMKLIDLPMALESKVTFY